MSYFILCRQVLLSS